MAPAPDLDRFVAAQAGAYAQALCELEEGRKRSHWMWFIFPQITGLGHSAMAIHYALGSREEAHAYLHHPVLGARLRECTLAVLRHSGEPAERIFGEIDALKFRSSMTLFDAVADERLFARALSAFYDGPDPRTLDLLG